MLPVRLLIIKIFLSQTLNYLNQKGLVKAEQMNTEYKLTPEEKSLFLLSTFVVHKVFENWKEEEFFQGVPDLDYVTVAAFQRGLINIESLEKKLSGSTLEFWTWNRDEENGTQILKKHSQDFKFISVGKPMRLPELQLRVKKHVFKSLFNEIKGNNFHVRTEILVRLPLGSGGKIWLADIHSSMNGELNMYWYQKNPSEENIKRMLTENSVPYPENYKGILLLYTIELMKKHLFVENSLEIPNMCDKIDLHIDEMPTVFLYYTSKIPYLKFFEEFTIKLKPYDEQNLEIHEVRNFDCKPSILIEFSKTKNNSADYINLQIAEYEFDETNDTYSFSNENKALSYSTINFVSEPIITSKSSGIDLNTTIQTSKTTPVIKIYFNNEGLLYESEVYESLKDSIYEVIIYINEEENESVVFDNNLFKISVTKEKFEINLNFDELKPDVKITLLNSLVKDKNGILRIVVKCKSDTIIESIVCLNSKKMVVVSSNRLMEFLENIKAEKDKIFLSSQNNIFKVGTSSSKVSKRVRFKLPLDKLPSENNTNSNGGTPPKRTVLQGSILKNHITDQNRINKIIDQKSATDKHSQTPELEVSEYINISFIKVKNYHAFADNDHLIEPTYSQKPNNTNPRIEVLEITTPNDLIDTISNSKLDDTSDKEDSKSGRTAIIIGFVAGGVFVIGGFAAYLVFF